MTGELNPITEPEKVKKLLEANPANLYNIERQKRHILSLHIVPMPCPICFHKQNVYEAADGTKTVGGYYEGKFHCVNCGTELRHVVPFMSVTPWYWSRKNPPIEEELAFLKKLNGVAT